MGDIMTSGTSTAFKSGTGIAIIIGKDSVDEEHIEPGHVVEYVVRKCNIPKREKKRGKNFQAKKEPEIKHTEPAEPTTEQPEGSI